VRHILHTKTNAEGHFEFDGPIPPGDYLLGFRLLGTADGEVLPGASGDAPQSPWVEVPQTPGTKPIKLVLPILKK